MNYDPYDAAMKGESPDPQRFWGQLAVECYKCALIKGQGRVPYDPAVHRGRKAHWSIEFTIAHVDPTMPLIEHKTVQWSPDFVKKTQPSVQALLPDLAALKGLKVGQFRPLWELKGMWVSGQLVPQPEPQERFDCMVFDAIYADEDTCRAAYEANSGQEIGDPTAGLPFEPEESSPESNPEREALAAFLPAMWGQAKHQPASMEELLKKSHVLSAVFDLNSPEVKAVMSDT